MQKFGAERHRHNCKQTAEKGKGYDTHDEAYEISAFEVMKRNQEIGHWKNKCDRHRHRPGQEENSEFFGKVTIHLRWAI
jgi:hypothetical protein